LLSRSGRRVESTLVTYTTLFRSLERRLPLRRGRLEVRHELAHGGAVDVDDLRRGLAAAQEDASDERAAHDDREHDQRRDDVRLGDRKSTRLNSSHVKISYAVFCL